MNQQHSITYNLIISYFLNENSHTMEVNQENSRDLNNTDKTKTLKTDWFVNLFTASLHEVGILRRRCLARRTF